MVQQRKNVLKAPAGYTWGCDKENLLTTYQTIDRSILSYCCPVWTPSHKDTNCSRLQRAQNSALRIATGCLKMADVAEPHQEARELPVRHHNEARELPVRHHNEARELPVRQHNEQISQRFVIAWHLPKHPCHQLCYRPPDNQPDRRRSMIGRFKLNIQQYLAEEPLNNTSYKSAINIIHSDAV